jgi:predicted RNA-binding Zn ribbon-like protein
MSLTVETSAGTDQVARVPGGRLVRELPIVAGDLALDFANTVDDPEGEARHDHVATYPDLIAWAVRRGAIPAEHAAPLLAAAAARPARARAAVRRAHELRAALGATFTEVAESGTVVPEHWARLRPFAVTALGHAAVVADGHGFAFHWPEPREADAELDAVLWPVAHAAVALLTGPDVARVKRCAGCPWLFVDRSRNASRRWCAMEDCGTHAKIVRYVARRAARRAGGR